jgi:hypothetical protein
MDENRARRVVDALRERGVMAHLARPSAGRSQPGVRVVLGDGREALWDTDGTAGLEAQVMRDGVLVGFVPKIAGSEDFDEAAVGAASAATDYDAPVATRRRTPPSATGPSGGRPTGSEPSGAGPASSRPGGALPREGGLLRRFMDGFRES